MVQEVELVGDIASIGNIVGMAKHFLGSSGTYLGVIFSALALSLGACSQGSGMSAGTGGHSGVAGAGGSTSSAGSNAVGGDSTTGGAAPAGGNANTGGSTSSGGLPALHVEGNKVKDPNGKTIILRGVSLIDIGALYQYSNQSAAGIRTRIDKVLSAGLQPRVIRLPVYPRTVTNGSSPAYSPAPYPVGPNAPSGTHASLTPDQYYSNILKPAVDYVTTKGMYAIIDFHQIDDTDDSVRQSAADANTFWQYMADKFKDYSNVLYEPFNEPIDSSSYWSTLKPRAQKWVDTIRAAAPNNIIIVSSNSYCQKPGDASASPLSGSNLMYTAHVYPGNWTSTFKTQVSTAVAKVPVFFTEWGYVLNGSDSLLGTNASTWGTDFEALVDGNGSSWTAWVTDNAWTPNMFSDTNLTKLSDFGTLAKNWLSAKYTSDWVQ